jgi:hypothetical protein
MKRFTAGFLLLMTAAGCSNVPPVTSETAGPKVVFTQSGVPGNITSLTLNADSNAAQFFNAVATDPGGVKSINLVFTSGTGSCTTVMGAVYSGVFTYSPVPANQNTTSTPDGMGLVPTELFTTSTVQGPFTCNTFLNPPQTSRPYGDTVYANVTATNYSGKSTNASLPMTFQ